MFLKPQPTCETNCANPTSNNAATIETDTNESTITVSGDKTEQDVRNTVQKLYETTNGEFNSKFIRTYDDNLFMSIDGAKSLLPAKKTYGLFVHYNDYDSIDSEEQLNIFISTLSKLGFIKNDEIDSSPMINELYDYINRNNGVACSLSGVRVTCAHESWVSNETIELANELADAYYAKKGAFPYTLDTNSINITDSEIPTYQKMMIPSGNAMALFYRTPNSDEWQYFTSTQFLIPCEEYNTADLKNAFAGSQCEDIATGQQLTVQP